MSIPKKGSRQIEVDGVKYRWHVRRRASWHTLKFAVAREDAAGAILAVQLPISRPDPWFIGLNKDKVVTPGYVAEIIRFAIAAGWKPEVPGAPFILGPEGIPRLPETELILRKPHS